MFVQNLAYAHTKMGRADLLNLPLVAYYMLIDAWRAEDDMQRTMNARIHFAIKCATNSKELEEYIK